MLKMHYPIGVNGNKYVYKNSETGEYVLASYSTQMHTPEVLLFNCDGLGNVKNWKELYGERGPDMTPSDLFKVVDRYNQLGRDRMP